MGKTARRYHHGDLRNALVGAAAGLVKEREGAGFTLREVAARAGVTHPAAYRHFSDKQALLAAVADAGFRALRERQSAALDGAGDDARARLMALAMAYWDFAAEEPGSFRVMFGEPWDANGTGAGQGRAASFALLREEVARAASAGLLPADTDRMVSALWSVVHGLAVVAASGQLKVLADARERPRDFVRETVAATLEAIAGSGRARW